MTLLFLVCGLLVLGFTAVGCFHDASNSVAVPVRAGALTPKVALVTTACFNVLGLGLGVAFLPWGEDAWLNLPATGIGAGILVTALLATVLWELLTWRFGMPASSTHALIGGVLGASWAARAVGLDGGSALEGNFLTAVGLPLILAPLLAFAVAWVAVVLLVRLLRYSTPRAVRRRSRYFLSLASVTTSLAHGIYFGHRAFALGLLTLMCADLAGSPGWCLGLFVLLALGMVAGTLGGGWRISHTIASRMVHVDAFRGAIAQLTTCVLIMTTAVAVREPFSTSQVTASAVLGSGSNQRFAAVRHRTVLRLLATWLVTIPLCAVLAAVFLLALSPLLGTL